MTIATEARGLSWMRVGLRLAVSLVVISISMLGTPALAQEGQACAWSVGTASNYAFPARSFSLLTPEGSWSISPSLSTHCTPVGTQNWRPWAGVDVVPTLQHSYRRLAERGSLVVLARMGMDRRLASATRVGLHVTTNTAAWGFGARLRYLPTPKPRFGVRGFDLRLDLLAGETPDLQASVVVHLNHRWVGNKSQERHLAAEDWVQARAWHVGTGFEIGTITGIRAELTPGLVGSTPEIGLRAGALTNLFADTAVQPIALAYVGVPLSYEATVQPQLVPQAGITRRDGVASPIAGVAFELDPPAIAFQVHMGVLVGLHQGRLWQSVDAGFGSVW